MKHLITDCDGVLLNWERGFREYLETHHDIFPDRRGPTSWDLRAWIGRDADVCRKLVEEFNASEHFANLRPLPAAATVLKEAQRRGYIITVVTSCSIEPEIEKNRLNNLRRHFGQNISDIICLPLGASKGPVLSEWTEAGLWVEDNYDHAMAGDDLGHEAIVLRQSHNRSQEASSRKSIRWVDSWLQILSLLD